MSQRLSKEEGVTIRVLAEKGMNHCEIGRWLGATEGAVRHYLRRDRGRTPKRWPEEQGVQGGAAVGGYRELASRADGEYSAGQREGAF